MTLGGYLIWVAFLFEILTLTAFAIDKEQWARYGYYVMTLFITVSSALLFYHFLTRDFRLSYVTAYSSSDLPFIYTLSAFWAGQEGSFLLWAFFAALVGLFLFRLPWDWQRPVMIFYNLVTLSLFILLIKQTPFRLLEQIPMDGRGLNPLLANPWMAIHPPVMFLGYAAYGLPFAFVMAAMWRKDISHWLNISYRWLVFAWLSLGIGIILGGYWAYETLGWGGYRGWDPVENASLVPWLFGTALLHGLVLQRRYSAFFKSNVLLAIFSFIFILYGTFLTRSGILSDFSVHSFVDLGITGWLVIIMSFFLLMGLGLFFIRIRSFPSGTPVRGILTPPALLAVSVILLVLSGIMVILGTSSPLISRLWDNPAQVGIPFYINTQVPIYLVLLVVFTFFALRRHLMIPLTLASLASVTLSFYFGIRNPIHLALIAVSVSTIFSRLVSSQRLSVRFIHAGVGVFILGSVFATGYDTMHKLTLPQDTPVTAGDYTLTFREFGEPVPGEKTAAMIDVTKHGTTYRVKPRLWFNEKSNQLAANPDIRMHFLLDEYYSTHEYRPPSHEKQTLLLKKGEEKEIDGILLTFQGFDLDRDHKMGMNMVVRATITVSGNSQTTIMPEYRITGEGSIDNPAVEIPGTDLKVQISKMEATSGTILLGLDGPGGQGTPAKAIVEFTTVPLISLVWLGTIMMILGGILGLFPFPVVAAASKNTDREEP